MPSPVKPYGGSSRQRLTDLINSANKSQLIEGVDFEYGDLQSFSPHPGTNTKVTLRSLRTDKVDADVFYTRLGIDVLANLPPSLLQKVHLPEPPFSIHDVLDEINRALGLDLEPDEVVNLRYTTPQESYTLRIAPNRSLAWRDSQYLFKAEHAKDLSVEFTITSLNGLHPPAPR